MFNHITLLQLKHFLVSASFVRASANSFMFSAVANPELFSLFCAWVSWVSYCFLGLIVCAGVADNDSADIGSTGIDDRVSFDT